jgi:hypothetical protein
VSAAGTPPARRSQAFTGAGAEPVIYVGHPVQHRVVVARSWALRLGPSGRLHIHASSGAISAPGEKVPRARTRTVFPRRRRLWAGRADAAGRHGRSARQTCRYLTLRRGRWGERAGAAFFLGAGDRGSSTTRGRGPVDQDVPMDGVIGRLLEGCPSRSMLPPLYSGEREVPGSLHPRRRLSCDAELPQQRPCRNTPLPDSPRRSRRPAGRPRRASRSRRWGVRRLHGPDASPSGHLSTTVPFPRHGQHGTPLESETRRPSLKIDLPVTFLPVASSS